ncbi:LOW QUALITY PROTEIN: zf-RVT domain-containing protein, partial [Cephalotus follicularis]
RSDILHRVGCLEGMLPVTYLGLPLITKRLSKGVCSTLVERITDRANSWVSKALSFAGRLQLVKATLLSMQCYWCNIFLLPMSTIKECERVLRTFLWGGRGRAKVKWADVCKPFSEGGLGIHELRTWNKALLNISATLHGHLSWSWRQILRLRSLVKEHLIYKCGNGEHFSLWFDPWLHGDSVHALYGHRVMFEAGLSKHARVKEVIRDGQWCWPQALCDVDELQQRLRNIPISTAPDSIHWDKVGEVFSTASAYHGIRQRFLSVDWHDIVWHSRRIPKHAFSLWLVLRGAHRTKDKLLAIGVVHSADCAFLCGETETLQHLFFQCPFSSMV